MCFTHRKSLFVLGRNKMNSRPFRQMLKARQEYIGSLVCVGLDPLIERMPEEFAKYTPDLFWSVSLWMRSVIEQTAPFACMYKLQSAHWESIPDGVKLLRAIISHIHNVYPKIPVFLDCKRGDIGRTQERYRVAHFDLAGADGINYNGYMGVGDTLEGLIDRKYPGRALVGLGRTSNSSAWEIQDRVGVDGLMLWEFMVKCIFASSSELSVLENAGIVMGVAHADPKDSTKIYSWHLSRAREIVGDKMWFLIPGVGAQGGFVKETISTAYVGAGSLAINSSSGIIFSDNPAVSAESLRDEIRKYV